jgi:hypothetical protein
MAISVKYFNSFILKKTVVKETNTQDPANHQPVFTGLPWNPTDYPAMITSTQALKGRARYTNNAVLNKDNWIVEEARIRGDFNGTDVGYSPRAYLREEISIGKVKTNALIYSGVFNSLTGLNETNVFSVGETITKATDPIYGSIQKIHALDTNLAIFQENKVSSALIDKDAIYNAQGGGQLTTSNMVIGQITPYAGDYGISTSPESFAYFGYRRYFVDQFRNSVMRLSQDGLTPISEYGMKDFFRDKLSEINNNFYFQQFECNVSSTSSSTVRITSNLDKIEKGATVLIPQASGGDISAIILGFFGNNSGEFLDLYTDQNTGSIASGAKVTVSKQVKDKILGGYDNYSDNYTLSLQKSTNFTSTTTAQTNLTDFYTLTFDEGPKGWVSFFTYKPDWMFSLKNKFFTVNEGETYQHYINENRNTFYGISSESNISMVFNVQPSVVKNFKTINYEGSSGWQVTSAISNGASELQDEAKPIRSYKEGLYTENGIPYRLGFNRKENKYFATIVDNSAIKPGEVLFGSATTGIKGFLAKVTLSTDTTTDVGGSKELFAVSSEFVLSSK